MDHVGNVTSRHHLSVDKMRSRVTAIHADQQQRLRVNARTYHVRRVNNKAVVHLAVGKPPVEVVKMQIAQASKAIALRVDRRLLVAVNVRTRLVLRKLKDRTMANARTTEVVKTRKETVRRHAVVVGLAVVVVDSK